jgi:hypothetical protein
MSAIAINIRIEGDFSFLDREIGDIVESIAKQVPIEANKLFEQPKHGRLYRAGSLTTRRTKKLERAGLRGKRGTKTRLISGSQIHRASAKGESPAKRSGKLGRQIKALRKTAFEWRVTFGAPYAGYLEFNLDRPYVAEAVENAVRVVLNQ